MLLLQIDDDDRGLFRRAFMMLQAYPLVGCEHGALLAAVLMRACMQPCPIRAPAILRGPLNVPGRKLQKPVAFDILLIWVAWLVDSGHLTASAKIICKVLSIMYGSMILLACRYRFHLSASGRMGPA